MRNDAQSEHPVTVILPVHNPGNDLDRSLASVVGQTHQDLEILVVDDGSSTDAWRDHLALADPRVRIISQPRNLGVSRARNRGVREASNHLVAFLDQDDSWEPTKLQRQIAAMTTRPNVSVCSTGFYWHLANGDVLEQIGYPATYNELLDRGMVNFCSILTYRDLYLDVGGCDPTLTWAQDHDLVLKLLMVGNHVAIPELLTHYYLHEGNRSRAYRGSVASRRIVLRKHELRAIFRGDTQVTQAAIRGYGRAWELYTAQAFDKAREARRSGRTLDMAAELFRYLQGKARRPLVRFLH